MRIPSWLIKISLSLLSFLLMSFFLFASLEAFPGLVRRLHLTSVHYFALKERYVTDPDLIFRLRPNYSYRTYFAGDMRGLFVKKAPLLYTAAFDGEGFRNKGKTGDADIVLLGDSFIQAGVNEEDTLAARLQRKTGKTVLNYGMEWYGPPQYLQVLRKFALARKPKIAVFCLFEGNDLRDTREYLRWQNGSDYYHFYLTQKNFFQRYVYAAKDTALFLAKALLRNWDPRKVDVQIKPNPPFEHIFSYPVDLRTKDILRQSDEIRMIGTVLEDFKRLAEENQIKPVVVFIPSSTHIFLPYVISGLSAKEYQRQLAAKTAVEEMLEELTKKSGIPWISLTPSFEKAAEEGKILYYPTDTHWNTEGRELAAEVLEKALPR